MAIVSYRDGTDNNRIVCNPNLSYSFFNSYFKEKDVFGKDNVIIAKDDDNNSYPIEIKLDYDMFTKLKDKKNFLRMMKEQKTIVAVKNGGGLVVEISPEGDKMRNLVTANNYIEEHFQDLWSMDISRFNSLDQSYGLSRNVLVELEQLDLLEQIDMNTFMK